MIKDFLTPLFGAGKLEREKERIATIHTVYACMIDILMFTYTYRYYYAGRLHHLHPPGH